MRKSLNELQQIENYLLGQMSAPEQQAFYAQVLINHELWQEVDCQRETYAAIRAYGRQKLKAELEAVYQKQSATPKHRNFFDSIKNLFTSK